MGPRRLSRPGAGARRSLGRAGGRRGRDVADPPRPTGDAAVAAARPQARPRDRDPRPPQRRATDPRGRPGQRQQRRARGHGEETDPRARAELLDRGLEKLAGYWGGGFEPAPAQRPRIPIWVAGRWPNRRPLRRAARWDGFFPIDLPGPAELAELAAEVTELRERDGAFDLVAELAPGADPAPWADAGATWVLTSFPIETRADEVRAAIEPGRAESEPVEHLGRGALAGAHRAVHVAGPVVRGLGPRPVDAADRLAQRRAVGRELPEARDPDRAAASPGLALPGRLDVTASGSRPAGPKNST